MMDLNRPPPFPPISRRKTERYERTPISAVENASRMKLLRECICLHNSVSFVPKYLNSAAYAKHVFSLVYNLKISVFRDKT